MPLKTDNKILVNGNNLTFLPRVNVYVMQAVCDNNLSTNEPLCNYMA